MGAAENTVTKQSFGILVALVVGSIICSAIFVLLQNMAAGAGAVAILIGWTITGIGMLLLRVGSVALRNLPWKIINEINSRFEPKTLNATEPCDPLWVELDSLLLEDAFGENQATNTNG